MKHDLTGQKFGRLTVIKENGRTPGRQILWDCICDCGNKLTIRAQDLRNGHTKSCGCYKQDKSRGRKTHKINKFKIIGDTMRIYVSNRNKYFLIDTKDYDLIKDYYWRISFRKKDNYYTVETNDNFSKPRSKRLSRVLLGITDKNIYIDHINGDPLDNRRQNLRIATPHQNSMNRRWNKSKKDGVIYKGVAKNYHKWVAHIGWKDEETKHHKNIYLGSFTTPEEAARAYDAKAKELYGEFAKLNFPELKEEPDMTPTEITLKLRDDCIMILDAAKAWPVMEGHTWKEKQDAMAEIMKSREDCEELIGRIDEVAMNDAAAGIFSNEFIRGTAKLLQYRIDANDLSVGPAVNKRRKTSAGKDIADNDGSWDAQLDAAARAIGVAGQTVLGYKMIQELGNGDPAAVAKLVSEKLGPSYGDVEISMVQMNAMDLREKMNYMNHRIWLIEPSLPVYVINAAKKAEA